MLTSVYYVSRKLPFILPILHLSLMIMWTSHYTRDSVIFVYLPFLFYYSRGFIKRFKKWLRQAFFVTHRIVDGGESIFDFIYLWAFEAKIAKALTVLTDLCWTDIFTNKSKNRSHVSSWRNLQVQIRFRKKVD